MVLSSILLDVNGIKFGSGSSNTAGASGKCSLTGTAFVHAVIINIVTIKILEPFAKFGIGMVNIESRPSRQGLWDYLFFIDIEGHSDDRAVSEALDTVKERVKMFKLLGSYPKAVL